MRRLGLIFLVFIITLILFSCGDKTYTVLFEANGGVSVDSQRVKSGDKISIPAVSKEGYSLEGWYISINQGQSLDEKWSFASNTVNSDVVLYAKWIVNQYSIKFNSNGGSDIPTITQEYNTDIIIPEDPTREGYTFLGWDQEIPEKMPGEDNELTAQWKINQYTLSFVDYDGEILYKNQFEYGEDISGIEVESPTRIGHTFTGWSQSNLNTMSANDLTVKAVYKVNSYHIHIDANGGYSVSDILFDFDSLIIINEPTKVGYKFIGWNIELPSKMPDYDIDVIAQWEIGKYSIEFNSNGGSNIPTITQEYNTNIIIPEDPTREGYTFLGWDQEIPEKMPGEDNELTAQWKINQYTLSFVDYDGETISTILVEYDSSLSVVTPPEFKIKPGYHGHWELPEKMPSSDLEIMPMFQTYLIYNLTNNVVEITGINDVNINTVIIPEYIDGYRVEIIKAGSFSDLKELEEIFIPNSIQEIENRIFNGNIKLKKITIPFIGTDRESSTVSKQYFYSLFSTEYSESCYNAKNHHIPNSLYSIVITDPIKITDSALFGISSIEEITIPFVGEMEGSSYEFGYIFGATEYNDSYKANGYYVPNKLKTININSNLNLNMKALRELTNIQYINIVDSNPYYSSLKGIIYNKSFTSIKLFPQGNKDYHITFELPSTVTTIDSYAFYKVMFLSLLNLSRSISTIKEYAFAYSDLSVLSIPKTVTTIGYRAVIGTGNIGIYTEFKQKPYGWHVEWNPDNVRVVWDYEG